MKFVHAFTLVLELSLAACFLLFLDSIKDSIDLVTAFYIGMALVFFGSAITAGMSVWLYYQYRDASRPAGEAERARSSQSGNIFFALFGAVALVGVIGATLTTVLKGPVTGMQRVTKYTIAENNMIAAGKLALIAAGSQEQAGDCDGDGMVEPVPYSSTGDGPFPVGGGYLPAEISATRQDPWGNMFGYCVWDHGVDPENDDDNDGECGESASYLPGDDSEQHIVLAIISSGPDRVFQTNCGAHPDYVMKETGSDDIVLAYTYAEAGSMSGGLWRLKSGDADTAEVGNRNIEVIGSSGSDVARIGFDEGLGLSGVGEFLAIKTDNIYSKTPDGTVIMQSPLRAQMVDHLESPPDSDEGGNGAACANPLAEMGDIIFNKQHQVLQYCNGNVWVGLWGERDGIEAAGSEGEIQFNDGEGAFAADSGLRWDNAAKRLFVTSKQASQALRVINMQTSGNGAHAIYGRSDSTTAGAAGIYGIAMATSGSASGVWGQSNSASGRGMSGLAGATSGTTYGGHFESRSSTGIGVLGMASATGGKPIGVAGRANVTSGYGVEGTGFYGVVGQSGSINGGAGVRGSAQYTSGANHGGYFQSASRDGKGVYGVASAVTPTVGPTGTSYGVYGEVHSNSGYGVYGISVSATGGTGGYFHSNSASGRGLYCSSSNASGCGGNRAWTNASDGRLKRDVVALEESYGLNAIMRLRPVSYAWRTENSDETELGFIAQEVEPVLPALVGTSPDTEITGDDGSKQTITDVKSLSYAGFVVPLVKAVQELKADNDNLRTELEALKAQIWGAERP